MGLVSNWKEAYKSLAVLFPTVIMLASALLNIAVSSGYITGVAANLIEAALASDSVGLAIIVALSSFVGRVIRQPDIGVK